MQRREREAKVRTALLRWYARHARDLPWRRTRNPYHVWVAEIMLQQTQVATVCPYYRRFLRRFPSLRCLARADEQAVLKAWEGLGYYGRARHLHRAARRVVRDHDGRLPQTAEALRRLPGVGRYTAGAIASIAFGRDEPVLDGNVARVLCRLFAIRGDPKRSPVNRRLWSLAADLLPARRAGEFNQAMMDLGATICTPVAPHCGDCPVSQACRARLRGVQTMLPTPAPRRRVPHVEGAVGVIRRRGRLLISRRRPDDLLGGLWEFPGGKRRDGEALGDCVVREVREELGVRVRVVEPLVRVEHAYSHFRVTLHAFVCDYVSGRPRAIECDDFKWVWPSQLDRYAFPRANHRIIAALRRRNGTAT